MDIRLNQDEVEAIQHITDQLEECMGLSKDYFSFKKERGDLRQGNGLNSVWFLVQKEGVSEEEALEQVKSKVLSLEKDHNTAVAELMGKDALTAEMQRYLTFFFALLMVVCTFFTLPQPDMDWSSIRNRAHGGY
jgi:hypothetical protein